MMTAASDHNMSVTRGYGVSVMVDTRGMSCIPGHGSGKIK